MAVIEPVFIRLVSACQFLETNVTLDFTKIKQMVWSQMGGKDCLHIRHSFFYFWKSPWKRNSWSKWNKFPKT